MIALDLFAGHGWGVACRQLGIEEYGVELMPEARAVRELNGMQTIYEDVWDGLVGTDGAAPLPPIIEEYDLLIASPPCQTFSMAGGGAGRRALDEVLAAIDARLYMDPAALVAFGETHDPKTALVLAPLAHIARDAPQYVVLEQVPPVLPVWERYAEEMRRWGYSVWTGNLQAEMYGTVVTCPLHTATASGSAARGFALDPATLATADRAGTEISAWLESVPIAAARETFIRERASVESARRRAPGMTAGAAAERAAWNAALVSRAVLEDAHDATWLALVKPLLSRALAETRTLPGRAGDMSMSAATSGFESTVATGESIESLPSRLWGALCDLAKSYITSTERPTTTTPATSQSSAATHTIDDTIASVIGRASCGACNDHAVPQTRKRAILNARADGREAKAPTPTHSRYYSRDPQRLDEGVLPWVSMAEALGWGMTERPMVTAGNAVGRAEGVGGSGAKIMRPNYSSGGAKGATAEERGRTMRPDSEPSLTMTSKGAQWQEAEYSDFAHPADLVEVDGVIVEIPSDVAEAYENVPGGAEAWAASQLAKGQSEAIVRGQVKQVRTGMGKGMIERHGARPSRDALDPAFTVLGGNGGNSQPGFGVVGRPAPTVTGGGAATGGAEVFGRHGRAIIEKMRLDPNMSATTVAGDPRLSSRDHHEHGAQAARATRVTVAEAAILQSYPADFRWDAEITDPKTGRVKPITKTNTFLQIGNAVPVGLAAAILREVLS